MDNYNRNMWIDGRFFWLVLASLMGEPMQKGIGML